LQADDEGRHCSKFPKLHSTQHPAPAAENRKTVLNPSDVPVADAACSALGKGLKYALALVVLPIEDFLIGVVKVGFLPEENAEEVR
jgi:hypothetical protein